MTFAVGILYSAQQFLELVVEQPIKSTEFLQLCGKFAIAPPDEIFRVSQRCRWIEVAQDGRVQVTDRGRSILVTPEASIRLRSQVWDVIAVTQPPWSKKLMYGREEALTALPADAQQCFGECGLLESWDDETIRWWDDAAQHVRFVRSGRLFEVGRQAERWTVEHERVRTGSKPYWQSLDSAFAGYDVLSIVSKDDPSKLRIEVKGSELPPKEAYFHLSQNEWRVAETSGNYAVYLWHVGKKPRLYVIQAGEIAGHIPKNCRAGRWDTTKFPFSAFLSLEVRSHVVINAETVVG